MAEQRRKLVSIVIPVFNEEENVRPLYHAVSTTMAKVAERYDYEMVFTDNHSSDRTFEILAELAAIGPACSRHPILPELRLSALHLHRYMSARGAAAIQLDCDLQDPLELIDPSQTVPGQLPSCECSRS